MELIWFEDYLALAETLNFSRAAELRHVTQPAFSRRIRALEAWVGTELFARTTHGVSLTPAGEHFHDQAEVLTRALHQLRRDTIEVSDRRARPLSIAATHALSFTFFPQWVRRNDSILALGNLNLISDSMQACEQMMLRGDAPFLLCHHHKDVSSRIAPGEFFGFLGPNGAGKSTTIHCITGIATPTSGSIKVFGIDAVKNYREARRMIGLSPQEFNVDTFATPAQILDWMGGYFGLREAERKARADMLIEKFDLVPHAKKQFRQLSGGLKRRVILARALIHDPKLLILDEPTAGVDVELRMTLWGYLQELNRDGKTILLTSHYLEEIERLCKTIAVVAKGKVARHGPKEEFFTEPGGLEKAYLAATGKAADHVAVGA